MRGGLLVVKGRCGTHTGEGMSGGTIIVGGACGIESGKDMAGGMIISRLFMGLGNNAEERSLSDEDMALVKQHLDLTRFEEIKYRKAVPRNPLSPLPPVARMQGESQARELMSKTFYPPSAPPHHE